MYLSHDKFFEEKTDRIYENTRHRISRKWI